MRERPPANNCLRQLRRITPAYAGKTYQSKFDPKSQEDHPRVCGKDRAKNGETRTAGGSPPRMRERPKAMDGILKGVGITPAYAGKTDASKHFFAPFRDHPRVCGKDRMSGFKQCVKIRITPAYAGKTQCIDSCRCRHQDHPRVCGKDATTPVTSKFLAGITPAYAGKTVIDPPF